jgi:hypothetical protein
VGGECQRKRKKGKRMNLFDFLIGLSSKKRFSKPYTEWLELIETMCNEILGNYTKKEDQLMTAAFGTRENKG